MAESNLHSDVEGRINEYLDAIDKSLVAKGLRFDERRSVTADVDAQIRDMLASSGSDSPTSVDLEAVLRRLDAPESYAEDADLTSVEQPAQGTPESPGKFSRTAIVGALWAPMFFINAFLLCWARVEVAHVAGQPPSGPSTWQVLASITIIPLGLSAPFGMTILGWIAASRIRASNGRLRGLGLALFDGLLFPLILLDILVYFFWRVVIAVAISWKSLGIAALGRPSYSAADRNWPLIFILAAITALIIDWLIARWAWRKANMPMTADRESKT